MKKLTNVIAVGIALVVLVGCSGKTKEVDSSSNESTTSTSTTTESSKTSQTKESQSTSASSTITSEKSEPDVLANYSNDQIEYARVWLTVIGTNTIQELNVNKIPAGTLINAYDETSATYPEDVIALSGTASADGHVIYKSNHNGTITVYDVPSHWQGDSSKEAPDYMKNFTQAIINNAKIISVDPNNADTVKVLIDREKIN